LVLDYFKAKDEPEVINGTKEYTAKYYAVVSKNNDSSSPGYHN
jgi:hypothetical protein